MSSVSPLDQVPQPKCCMDVMEVNVSCPGTDQCASGCYRRWNEDGTSSCVRCRNESVPVTGAYSVECRSLGSKEINFTSYRTTVTPLPQPGSCIADGDGKPQGHNVMPVPWGHLRLRPFAPQCSTCFFVPFSIANFNKCSFPET
ncbi:uncharacterized protein C1orf159 homolog isoform X4 [Petaurus breviceps papuanus]|uniref:uncharacterized protein C1orf159 homolog isoform X4 n=1 Tax=Petaurus breviceps papuanus TaxID=3040969 RepID=UPI0036DE0C76